MPSKVYQYYPVKEERLSCIVCDYPYALDAPLSTLKKHLRVKHGFSIRNPPSSQLLDNFVYFIPEHTHTRIDIKSLLNPESPAPCHIRPNNYTFVNYSPQETQYIIN
ncbi:hypothetical protein DSO57_1032612 [Entomophthora muscae]|uniref:Uncharacterized protein n=1 Tax=Entomophthora muscae TaxID=34485 RepID=A0ACC2S279_9FUNG|nr:hypothetical protein DSO57_1032612 [Entomophthora muscae]